MKVGFIGSGNMGAALARATAKNPSAQVYLCDKDEKKAIDVAKSIGAHATDTLTLARECEVIFLAVKPNTVREVLSFIKDEICSSNATVITMAAGIKIATVKECLFDSAKVIRIMPNTPVAVGKGMILFCHSENITESDVELFKNLLSEAGTLDYIDEELIDAGSALSGCGPAFVYTFIEGLATGAEKCGLSKDKATIYAAQTLIGAATLLLNSDKDAYTLRDEVCSPGGSTIEGVRVLENEKLREITERAIKASYDKTLMLGK